MHSMHFRPEGYNIRIMDDPEEPQLIRTGKYTVSRKQMRGEGPRRLAGDGMQRPECGK
jgi:hypothetical protein